MRVARVSDETIGRHVRMMRQMRGMDAAELATLCGVGYQKALSLEAGGVPFDLQLICDIADILDTTPGRLVDGPVTHRMLDLSGMPDQQAAALEIMRDALVAPARQEEQATCSTTT
jgi:transcriptional regulator with XRE-family HTH domain